MRLRVTRPPTNSALFDRSLLLSFISLNRVLRSFNGTFGLATGGGLRLNINTPTIIMMNESMYNNEN